MKDKKILITGGAGAIGTILIKELIKDNEIYVIDNFSSGVIENLDGINCHLTNADIRDNDKLSALFKNKFDVVIHLAAHFANQNSVDFPISDQMVNTNGTLNILNQCLKNMPRFIYASSSCIYGGYSPPFSEDMKIDDLHTPYAISKYAGELYTRFYAKQYELETISLRFFNNFGPYDLPGNYRNVLPNFLLKAIRNEDLTITGSGEETRAFNYCTNTVSAIIKAANVSYDKVPELPVFNVGTTEETKILYLAKKIIELTSSKSQIIMKGRRKWDHTSRRSADLTKITKHLGYEPAVSFDDGLEKTVEWFLNQNWKRY